MTATSWPPPNGSWFLCEKPVPGSEQYLHVVLVAELGGSRHLTAELAALVHHHIAAGGSVDPTPFRRERLTEKQWRQLVEDADPRPVRDPLAEQESRDPLGGDRPF